MITTRPDRGPEPAGGRDAAAGLRVDHRAARPRDRKLHGRRRAAADEPVRRAGPRRDHPPDYPGERLIACRNPVLAAERARKREDLLAATEKLLAPIIARVAAGPAGRRRRDRRRGRQGDQQVQDGQALPHHHHRHQPDRRPASRTRSTPRPPSTGSTCSAPRVPAADLDAPGVVTAYKNLKYVERDFRHIKADDLDLRPVFHRLEDRVKAHVLICMLACYLTWHLRQAWAPLTFTDEDPPAAGQPRRPRPAAPQPPRPRPPASTTKPAAPTAASAACSPTWPPSPATRSASPAPRHRPHPRRAHPRPAPGLRPHRRPDPAHLEVARTTTRPRRKTPGQNRNHLPNQP